MLFRSLFGAELVAIDGSKFKGLNNSRRNYSQEQLRELVKKIESRIEDYLQQLDTQDEQTQAVAEAPSAAALKEKMERLKATKGRYQELLGQLEEKAQNEVSLTDPDSRRMKGSHGEHLIGYNVQLAVDAKHDLIVVEEVSQCASDRGQLAAGAKEAKEALAVPSLKAVADKGYHEADQLEACEQAGIETFVPEPGTSSGQGKDGVEIFPKERFSYEASTDTYLCPAGQKLARCSESKSRGKDTLRYANYAACRQCKLKAQCTTGTCRMIGRRPNQAVLERAALRAKAHPQIIAQRKTIVEHVFGSLRNWHHDRFLMKGLEKVRAEFSLSALVYNLRRVINLVGLEDMTAATKDKKWVLAKG